MPAANGEEVPRAYLVKAPGKMATEEEIKNYVAERLSKYKRLEGGVVFLDALPRNANGKLLKRILRDEVKRQGSSKL